ncbi:MAG TPA: signal peptide peptidase SppA [Candidatus Limnocylindrales bacterium]
MSLRPNRRPSTSSTPPPPLPGPVPAEPDLPGLRQRARSLLPGVGRLFPPGRVAVLRLYGSIAGGARAADWIELTKHLRDSPRVPAVVLDVDSGGGSAAASDDLFLALERLAARKPLVVSIRGVGASGAYLAAMAGHRIVANPNAAVGSIGVIAIGPRVPRLLERAGVGVSETRAGRLKGMGAPWREETDEERAKEQELVDGYYAAFVGRVAASRKLSEERVRELATGELWLGTRARELGLVDEIGDLEHAIEVAARLAGVPARGAPVRLRRPLLSRLMDRFATRAASALMAAVEARLDDRIRM